MAKLAAETVGQEAVILIPIVAAIIGILNVVFLLVTRIQSVTIPQETQQQKDLVKIAEIIKQGAMAFLQKEYSYLFGFVIIMGAVVLGATESGETVGAFALGAFLSASCGWIGMWIAVIANKKTTYQASTDNGLNKALQVAFASGSVMGFGVVCSGIAGLIVMYAIVGGLSQSETTYLAGFGFGASAIALFARVGGGIYTKAADVGADLVGKVEENMPEDSPRNPATIADNVGDNVGDVAGMGADLFESFVGGIIASIQLASSYAWSLNKDHYIDGMDAAAKAKFVKDWREMDSDDWPSDMQDDVRAFIALPIFVAAFGIVIACLGIYTVRTSEQGGEEKPLPEDATPEQVAKRKQEMAEKRMELQEKLLWTIRRGIFSTSIVASAAALGVCLYLFGSTELGWKLWGCTAVGLVTGVLIGIFTEYATSFTYKPTQTIAKKGKTGAATVVIQGIGIGMLSTMGPTILIFIAILACYELGETYGIAIAAVGMLSTLGITLATDAFGPVADNAGGLAEMAKFDDAVRDTTDGLDALGNTTAATGKGFAIGSAVLAALALLSAFKNDADIHSIDVSESHVLAGAIFGACLPFIFAAMTMLAVGRAATMMIAEVREQIKLYNLKDEDNYKTPDYQRCVKISTDASVKEMLIPGVLAIAAPLFIGFLLGPEALGGMLVGGITCGFMLAVYMANSGGAWDNAKKWIEAGHMTDEDGKIVVKHTDIHAAAVTGDTIGDPFKDTSGPSLNILMKLMTMISLVFAKGQFKGKDPYESWVVALIIAVVFMVFATGLTLWMRAAGFGKMKMGKSSGTADEKEDVEMPPTESTNLVGN